MKTTLLHLAIITFTALSVNAQTFTDALNYSQTYNGGTARFTSMGGAFGALGGDFSSICVNPAGLGVYRTSEFTFTPSFKKRSVNSDYNGFSGNDSRNRLGIDNIGFIFSYKPNGDKEAGLVNLNFAFGYNRTNDYSTNAYASGPNASNSIMDFFEISPGTIDGSWLEIPADPNDVYDPFAELGSHFWPAILAYNTYLIDPLAGGGFIRALNENDGVYQRNNTNTNGYSGEYLFSAGANISNKLFLGASLTVHSMNYTYSSSYYEDAFETNDTIDIGGGLGDRFNALDYFQNYETRGKGYSMKIGGIFKPLGGLRIGLSLHTPIYYNLEDTYSYTLKSYMRSGNYSQSSPNGRIEYQLETPLKVIASIAYTYKNIGLLSLDIEHVNYSSMRLTDSDNSFIQENDLAKTAFESVYNIKVGGEVRYNDVYFRGGYAFYPSPYRNGYLNDKSNRSIISGGIGYRSGNFFMDAAYLYSMQNVKYYFYDLRYLDETSAVNPTSTKITEGKFLFTVGVKF